MSSRPFIMGFAVPIPPVTASPTVRFNDDRQLSEVLVEGKWVAVLDLDAPDEPGTRITLVKQETTDDE